MIILKSTWIAVGVALIMATTSTVYAANCALRNPDRQIYEIFPDATGYRSVVALVSQETKDLVERKSGMPMRLNDLGKHTIYVVFNNKAPIGFVHARTELGQLGGIELVWAIDLDMTILGFRVQRSRENQTEFIKSPNFRDKLIGQTSMGLNTFLAKNNSSVDLTALQCPSKAESISHNVITSGIRTISITNEAFSKIVFRSRLLGNTYRFFPSTAKVTKIPVTFNQEVADSAKKPNQIDPSQFYVLRASNPEGQALGTLVFSRWMAHPKQPEVWWALSPEGVVEKALVVGAAHQQNPSLVGVRLGDVELSKDDAPDVSLIHCATEIYPVLKAKGVIP